jgi:hypothetical protein
LSAARIQASALSGRADGVEHLDHRARRAAVQRTLQGRDPGQHRRGQARAGGGHDPRGEGRGVQAVVADRDQIGVQGSRLPVRGRNAARHAQHVGGVRQRRVRGDRRLAAGHAQHGGGEDGRGGDQQQGRVQAVAVGQAGDQGADSLDRVAPGQALVQGRDLGEGADTGLAQDRSEV